MVLLSHFFISKLSLEKTAGCGSVQILPDQRVLKEVRECLLGKEDLAAGVVFDFLSFLFKIAILAEELTLKKRHDYGK